MHPDTMDMTKRGKLKRMIKNGVIKRCLSVWNWALNICLRETFTLNSCPLSSTFPDDDYC